MAVELGWVGFGVAVRWMWRLVRSLLNTLVWWGLWVRRARTKPPRRGKYSTVGISPTFRKIGHTYLLIITIDNDVRTDILRMSFLDGM